MWSEDSADWREPEAQGFVAGTGAGVSIDLNLSILAEEAGLDLDSSFSPSWLPDSSRNVSGTESVFAVVAGVETRVEDTEESAEAGNEGLARGTLVAVVELEICSFDSLFVAEPTAEAYDTGPDMINLRTLRLINRRCTLKVEAEKKEREKKKKK